MSEQPTEPPVESGGGQVPADGTAPVPIDSPAARAGDESTGTAFLPPSLDG
ncbi:hypothetical protein [Streptomyces sp. NPDC088246]|uniref:hypothetical protein n=1 Tax=Streptomyces sp. NPDC088246 TaxID=3365842 RepID=UPI00382E2155